MEEMKGAVVKEVKEVMKEKRQQPHSGNLILQLLECKSLKCM